MNRDSKGRFTRGNRYAVQGWQGLVKKRFNGDEALARQWLAQLGRFAYASMFPPQARTATMQWRHEHLYRHPGQPEEFVSRFSFGLDELQELAF